MKIYQFDINNKKMRDIFASRHFFQLAKKKIIEKEVNKIFLSITNARDRNTKVFFYTKQFDRHILKAETVRVSPQEIVQAWKQVPGADRKIISLAAKRIRNFHEEQKKKLLLNNFKIKEDSGTIIEQRLLPIRRVGICIPAGRAPLFSTVLMTAIPAQIAGVKQIAMISPWPNGQMNPHILVAALMSGVDEIYKIGGVQGVAALAYGTETITNVEKIVGPGNLWVTQAKIFSASLGFVGIDSPAGPSEIVVLSDGSYPAAIVAADLISQCEHGEDSMAVLVTHSRKYAEEVKKEVEYQINNPMSKKYLKSSAGDLAVGLITRSLKESLDVVNWIAPEHLEIMIQNPRRVMPLIENAASIFLGPYSPVPIGDYLAGPNHVLPTDRRARFASPLGVEDFVKRQSVVEFSKEALLKLGPVAERMAELEGLDGHAQAIRIRREALAGKKPRKKSRQK